MVSLRHIPVKENRAKLRVFDGQTPSTVGVTSANVRHSKTKHVQKLDFHELSLHKQPLLGIEVSLQFD